MFQHSVPSSAQSADALRHQMERSIDELAELARSDIEAGQFFAEVLKRALKPGGAIHGVLWRLSPNTGWEPAGEMAATGVRENRPQQISPELLSEVAIGSQPRVVAYDSESNGRLSKAWQVFSPLRHGGQTVGILETRHIAEGLSPETYQFFSAVGEITADYLSQQELRQLRQAKLQWQRWDQYLQQLGQSWRLADVGAVIANDGRQLAVCDRISVLVRQRRGYRLLAASGVERINPRAGSVRSLESLATLVAGHTEPVWQQLGPSETVETRSNNGRVDQTIARHAQESGAVCFGAIPLVTNRIDPGDARPLAIVIFENFQAASDWPSQKSLALSLSQRSMPFLVAAVERDSIPWLGLWRTIQRGPRFFRRPAAVIGLLVVGIALAMMALVPAEFTVSGTGELWPASRRDLFASTSGVVDQILVDHGHDVELNQPLIVLRDPDVEQELPRVTGEIATTIERLRGVQIARLTGSGASEPGSRFRQLTSEEEELKERLKTLERQRALIEERRQKLTLRSPIAGRVLTWDTNQHLSARPVERGQSLLTIGETGGLWIVEVHIADKDAGHMLRAQSTRGSDLEVEFQLPSEPGRTHRGKIRDVALVSELNDRSSGHVRVIVEFDSSQIEQLRPGASAIPRIRCGRKPIGYVWFHDLIDAIWIRLLF